jgi:AP-1-like factor
MSSLSGLFTPTLLESVGNTSSFDYLTNISNGSNGSRSSADSASGNMSTGHNTSYGSPSVSSNSNHGPSSSCGTSPEPATQSPVYNKPLDSSLTTIGEEHTVSGEGMPTFCDKLNVACGDSQNPIPRVLSEPFAGSGTFNPPAFDVNGIDWFAQQNNNQFDPQLFGDYRESQDNILQNEAFGDSFFTDAFAFGDFATPFNMAPSPTPPKKGLVDQIDMEQNKDEVEEVVPGEDRTQMLSCNTIWYVPTTLTCTTADLSYRLLTCVQGSSASVSQGQGRRLRLGPSLQGPSKESQVFRDWRGGQRIRFQQDHEVLRGAAEEDYAGLN